MNRIIKFRVWLIKDKKMVYPSKPLELTGRNGAVYCWLEQDLSRYKNIDYSGDNRCVIQQFTGLFDKNNKEIYEGDIVQIKLKDFNNLLPDWDYNDQYAPEIRNICEIKWRNSQGFVALVKNGKYKGKVLKLKNNKDQIIGNILENPELLNKNS
jgi:uncharacterized phage protein (TIGR01671 family)